MDATLIAEYSTVALVLVTAVYVILTWRLSKSSKLAAQAAAQSATAAAESIRMQRAMLEASTAQRHAWFKTGGGGNSYAEWEIGVRPLLGAYYVHRVELLDVHFTSEVDSEQARTIGFNEVLEPVDRLLPAWVDEIEGVQFKLDLETAANREFGHDKWRISRWRCIVTISLSEFDESVRRLVVDSDPNRDPRMRRLKESRERGFPM